MGVQFILVGLFIIFISLLYLILSTLLAKNKNPYLGLIMPLIALTGAVLFFILSDIPLVSMSRSTCEQCMIYCAVLGCLGYFIYGVEKVKQSILHFILE